MKTLPIKFLLLFSLLAVIYSCEKDDSIVKQQNNLKTVALEEAKSFLDQSLEQSKSNPVGSFIISISDEINYEAITNTDEQLAVIPVTTAYENLYSRIVLLEIEDKLQSAILSLNTFESSTRDNFSGEMLITDLNGTFIKGLRIENNTVVSHYIKSDIKTDKKNLSFNTTNAKSDCENECPFSVCDYCGELGEVVVTAPSQPHNTYISIEVMFPDRDFGLNLGDYDYNFGGGGSGSGSNNDEDRIKNELNDPCARNIFTQLENGIFKDNPLKPEVQVSNENGLNLNFSESILKLFNDSQMFNYNIVDGATENPLANADTTPIPTFDPVTETYNITTILNSNYLSNATELSIARTMIHESVHAYLLYVYRTNPIGSIKEGLDRIYQDTNDINITHHQFMGQYVDAIAYSLYDWDLNYGTGGQLGWDYYQAMSWAGMTQYDVFSQIVEDELQREQIEEIILNEIESNTNSNGTSCD